LKKDYFRIDAALRHPALSPDEISDLLAIQPRCSWRAGSKTGDIVHKCTVWHGTLVEGAEDEYEEALTKAVLHLEARQEWLRDSFGEDGELDVTFAFYTDQDEGLLSEPVFYPELLLRLSKLNAGMRVQVWKREKEEGTVD
jgi:Domain of unknown function (DUF4279)